MMIRDNVYTNMLEDYQAFSTAERRDFFTIDFETQIAKNGDPSPFSGAKVVLWGSKRGTSMCALSEDEMTGGPGHHVDAKGKSILVGHNLKFEFLHLFAKHGVLPTMLWFRDNFCGIVDTSVAYYLDTAQSAKSPSLAKVCAALGVPHDTKDTLATNYFNKGLGADQVPRNLLEQYLVDDLWATEECAWRLYGSTDINRATLWVQGMLIPVLAQMEWNGLAFDIASTTTMYHDMVSDSTKYEELIRKWVGARLADLEPDEVDALKLSPRTLSSAFFGVPGVPYKRQKVVGKYKNGKPKLKVFTELATTTNPIDPLPGSIPTDVHGYPVTDSVLSVLENKGITDHGVSAIAGIIRAWRGKEKLVSTYLMPILGESGELRADLRGPLRVVHPTYNQTVTATGRLSSSSPNAQNMPSEVKKLVVPPWNTDDAVVVDADFKQLELWAAAVLSRDKRMMHDVSSSDVHYEVGAPVFGWLSPADMTKDTRRNIKGVNFGTIYGGGSKTISEQTGVDQDMVNRIQTSFKRRYPDYWKARSEWLDAAKRGSVVESKWDDYAKTSYAVRQAWHPIATRKFRYNEKSPPWGGEPSVTPSEAYNYPVQAFATGDIVPLFLVTMCMYSLAGFAGIQPFSTIHDSASWYCNSNRHATTVVDASKASCLLLPGLCQKLWGFHPEIPLEIEVAISKTWG